MSTHNLILFTRFKKLINHSCWTLKYNLTEKKSKILTNNNNNKTHEEVPIMYLKKEHLTNTREPPIISSSCDTNIHSGIIEHLTSIAIVLRTLSLQLSSLYSVRYYPFLIIINPITPLPNPNGTITILPHLVTYHQFIIIIEYWADSMH